LEDLQVPKIKKTKRKSVEVKVKVPLTGTSFMTFILIGLMSLIGYAGYLGVSSIWKFTHPQFNFSVDSVKSLGYIAKGLEVPPLPGPDFSVGVAPVESATVSYLQKVSEFKNQFRTQYPNSKLLGLSDNEFLNIGWEVCKAKDQSIANNGTFSSSDILSEFQAKLLLRYPNIEGLSDFLDGVGNHALNSLCGGK
jgi:hypothetical protein